ncbi:hypothetical protein [Streptomyces sp. NPDC046925]|uniref:hypothetical protein n=1 Tax=Streptomyces sp. NPDC046925 TaxID=3155375 RepID=UPI0033FBE27C
MATRPKPEPPVSPYTATESLRAALSDAGIVLPSLGADHGSPDYGLVILGSVRADVAIRLADVIRQGGRGDDG